MKMSYCIRFTFIVLAAMLSACSVQAALVTVSTIEVWNGSNNLHSAEGVTLSGSGTVAAPYVYTIPNGLTLANGGIIRLSATVANVPPNTDTNSVKLLFTGGNLQMDTGGYIDVGSPDRTMSPMCTIDLGGGSITGSGKIVGIDSLRTPGSGRTVKARSLQITNAVNVSLTDIDLHTEGVNGNPAPIHAITATNRVIVTGSINTSDIQVSGGSHATGFNISAGFISVSNIDSRALRSDGAVNNGSVTLKALNAAGGFSTGTGLNAHTNQIVVNGAIRTDGAGAGGGSLTLQSVVLRLDTGSSLAKATNGVLTVVEGTTNVSVTAGQLFMNVSGTLVGPSGQALNATNTVVWNGTVVNPYFYSATTVKPFALVGISYALQSQTLNSDTFDPLWGAKTFTKLSGPSWLTVAANGVLSGTPGSGDVGTNSWQVSFTASSVSVTGTVQIVVSNTSLVNIAGTEVWNGTNNPHAADGVTLAGSGTAASPYVYAIPQGMRIASGGSIRLSASVDYGAAVINETNHIKFQFLGGNLQIDSGGWIDVGHQSRNVTATFICDLGGGSVTGSGKILGIDHTRNAGSGVNVRFVTITNVTSVSLADIDVHVENINSTVPDLRINATNSVNVTGTIDTRYTTTPGPGGSCFIAAGSITVSNVDSRCMVGTSGNGVISLKALNAAGGWSTSYANNAYTNQLVIKGAVTTAAATNGNGGNLTLQAVVLRLDTGSSLAKATNGVLTVAEGTTNVNVTASQLFMNVSGTTVGPSGQVLNATNTVTWNGTLVAPYFTSSTITKTPARAGYDYAPSSQTLAGDAVNPQWNAMTFAKVSGPSWLSVAANGALSGTPANSDGGTNSWQVSVTDGSLSSTGTLQIVVGRLFTVSSVEVWNGSNNPHAADGVTLTGSGTAAAPYVYTIPAGLTIASGGIIRLSATVDWNVTPYTDTNHIKFLFTGGDFQIDSGGKVDVGHPNRNGVSTFICDLGGGSITGAGKIVGIDHTRSAVTSINAGVSVRFVTITNVTSVSLADIDLHVENINTTPPDLRINATNAVTITGLVDTRYGYLSTDAGHAGNCFISAGLINVNNVDARSLNSTGRNNGSITLKALNAAGGWSTGYANNAYTNQLIIKGAVRTDGTNNVALGNLTLQAVVLRLDAGSSLGKSTNGVLTVAEGTTNVNVTASQLFMNVSGTTVGPSGQMLNATNTVTWNGTLAAPYFTSSPMTKGSARVGVDYALRAQTLANDVFDPQWGTKAFATVSGPSWLTIATDGSLSGVPAGGDVGTNSWQVSVTVSSVSATGTLQIVVVPANTPIAVSGTEDWDGTNNPHAADGVLLSYGTGVETNPAVYLIPTTLTMSSNSVIRMSPTTNDDRSITLQFASGNLQMDSGATINIARRTRLNRQVVKFDMGGGNITGAGQIVGLIEFNNTPRAILMTNVGDIYMSSIDVHVENVGSSDRNMYIFATNHVEIGTIDNSDRDTGGGSGAGVNVSANTLTVSNVFTYARRPSGANGGQILLRALAAPLYSYANESENRYGNTLIARGIIQNHTNTDLGNDVTLQAVHLQLQPGFNLIMSANGYSTNLIAGYTNNPGIAPSDMFTNSSGITGLTASYINLWTNTPTTVAVSASANPTCPGDSVSFTATVTPGSAETLAGNVQFKTNGVNFGSPVTLTGSNATSAATTLLPGGNNSITAVYNGNIIFASSTGNLTQTVSSPPAINTASLVNGAYQVAYSQLVSASGGSTPYAFAAANLPPGLSIDNLSGEISGTPTTVCTSNVFITVTAASGCVGSTTLNLTIQKATPVLSVNNSPVTYDGTAKAATVSASVAGVVSSVLTGGAAGQTNAGTYAVTADFVPADPVNYNSLTAASAGNFVINPAASSLAIISSAPTNGYHDSVFFTATNLPAEAVGNVVFQANGVAFSTNSVVNGGATSLAITNIVRGDTNIVEAAYSGGGNYLGSTIALTQVVTNHPPVANAGSYSRGVSSIWHISVADLLTNATDAIDGDALTLVSVDTSTNGINVFNDGTTLGYTNTNQVVDQFTYTVTDGFGGTNSGVITLTVTAAVTGTSSIAGVITGNPTTLTAYGIPGETYITQRATNLEQVVWEDIATNVLTGTNVVISVTDSNPPPGSAFYRLKWQQP